MAICVIKLTRRHRHCLSYIFMFFNAIQILLGTGIVSAAVYIYTQVAPIIVSERAEIVFMFVVIALYGTHVILHWMMGMKISYRCFWQSHKKSTRYLLLLWHCAAITILVNMIIIASMSRKVEKHLIKSLKNSLLNAIREYLTDPAMKYNIDKLQITEQCCGAENYKDWHNIVWLNKYHADTSAQLIKDFGATEETLKLPIVPWSCCNLDFPMQCLHDPLQQVEYYHVFAHEEHIALDSINQEGCVEVMRRPIAKAINLCISLISLIAILQVAIFFVSRLLFTSCRNAILLNDKDGWAPGWFFGRGDCGYSGGRSLKQIVAGMTDSPPVKPPRRIVTTPSSPFTETEEDISHISPSASKTES